MGHTNQSLKMPTVRAELARTMNNVRKLSHQRTILHPDWYAGYIAGLKTMAIQCDVLTETCERYRSWAFPRADSKSGGN